MRRVPFFRVLARDFSRNGKPLTPARFLASLPIPNRFGALTWLRLYQQFENVTPVRAIAYRVLLHVHGLEMDRDVAIGPGLYLPHPHGVLFAGGTRVGSDCAIYGMVRFLTSDSGTPAIGDGVFLGDGARLLGDVRVGSGSRIGAGSVVTRDIPAGVTAAGVPTRTMRRVTGRSRACRRARLSA